MSDYNEAIIAEFRANHGQVGGPFEGAPLILLTTTGARSGEPRVSPVTYLRDGHRLLIFASNAGGPRHPAWYHNLRANPRVTVELGGDSFEADAVELTGAERDHWYARQAELMPAFADYQARTERTIPVIALSPQRVAALGSELVRIHDGLRADLARLRTQLADDTAAAPSLGAELRNHCLAFCASISEHHANEDRVFPALQAQLPGFAPALERLRAEHHTVAELVRELQALLDEHAEGRQVHAAVEQLADELEAHFAYEEAELVPVLDQGVRTNRGTASS